MTNALADFQVMPALSADEYAARRADIAEHGIRVPIDADEDGTVLDGHHRQRMTPAIWWWIRSSVPAPPRSPAVDLAGGSSAATWIRRRLRSPKTGWRHRESLGTETVRWVPAIDYPPTRGCRGHLNVPTTGRPLPGHLTGGPNKDAGRVASDLEAAPMSKLPDFLTTADVAEALAVSERTVQRWVDVGILRAVRLPTGRGKTPAVRVRRADVEALLTPVDPPGVAR